MASNDALAAALPSGAESSPSQELGLSVKPSAGLYSYSTVLDVQSAGLQPFGWRISSGLILRQ